MIPAAAIIMEKMKDISYIYLELSTVPSFYTLAHFVIAASVSLYVFPIQYTKESSKENFMMG